MPITLKVRDIMDTDVYFIDASKTVKDALDIMVERKVWSLVVEKGGLPVGVVTERDAIRRCVMKGQMDIGRVTVDRIMSSPLITVGPDASAGEVMTLLAEKGVRRVYVVEGRKVIGRVTQTSAFKALLNTVMTLLTVPYQL